MEILRKSSEMEMIDEFLKAEFASKRFLACCGVYKSGRHISSIILSDSRL